MQNPGDPRGETASSPDRAGAPGGARDRSALMLTDLVGYTFLTQRDEAGALALLEEHRRLVRPLLREHSGREVKTIGDAFLVEFASPLEAAQCAVAIQRATHERNARGGVTKVEVRIGLHWGEVVHQDGDVYGNTVNLLSRIEPLAEPGGICLSSALYAAVRDRIGLPCASLGEATLKNVGLPESLYRLELPWAVPTLSRETPWVARPAEEEQMRAAIARAERGGGSVVLLSGEAGIGKTRLAEESIRVAERAGFRILRGRAFPRELGSPYAPWTEMVREFLDGATPETVERVCGPVARELSKLVPDVATRFGPPGPEPGASEPDPEEARASFHRGMGHFFTNVSQEDPLLLLLDDLQWADRASLRLLEFVCRAVAPHRILLVGTYRPSDVEADPALSDVLRALHRERLVTTLALPRLDRVGVGKMIRGTFGEEASTEPFQSLVHERTGGNPFFVEEVLRSLVEQRILSRTPDGRWERKAVAEIGIPSTVREVVDQRFDRLDEPTQATLRIASVLGAEFSGDLLREVAGVGEEALIEQLERLVRAGLLEERTGRSRRPSFAFTDAQLRDVVYDEMLLLRRVRYHRKAAEALERLAGGSAAEVAGDLAYHFAHGQDAPKARDYSLVAAERWADLYAFDEAERQFLRTLELLEEAPDPQTRARAMDGLGRTCLALGRPDATARHWESAIRLYEGSGDLAPAGRLCRELADLVRLRPDLAPGRPGWIGELLAQGRRLLEQGPPTRELALLYEEWSVWSSDQGETAEARSMVEKAVAVARAIGDRRTEVVLYDELAQTLPLAEKGRIFDYLEEKERFFGEPGREDWERLYETRFNLSVAALHVAADPEAARRWAEKTVDAAKKMRNREWEGLARLRVLAPALLWAGELGRVEEELRAVQDSTALHPDLANALLEALHAHLALARGDLDGAERHASHVEVDLEDHRFVGWACLMAELHRQQGRPDEAVRILRNALRHHPPEDPEMAAWGAVWPLRLTALLAETVVDAPALGTRPEVDRWASWLDRLATRLDNSFGIGLSRRVQGSIALRSGEPTAAVVRLKVSADSFRRSGNRSELATTLERLAEAAAAAGDEPLSLSCLTEAKAIRRAMGAVERPAGTSGVR